MTIKEARQNLLTILANARIELPAGSLTGQEHAVLQESLHLLYTKALDAEELKKQITVTSKEKENVNSPDGGSEDSGIAD